MLEGRGVISEVTGKSLALGKPLCFPETGAIRKVRRRERVRVALRAVWLAELGFDAPNMT